ncbi:hypothetical protein HA402_006068 [Bradysia odoriphaga]|nr:hypothetical protein HA402_006068 [Bradysia odoriphaga]
MFSRDVRNQFLATVTVNILQIGFGAVLGWPSASLLVLEAEDSPLPSGPLTIAEKSWVSALMYLGGSLGCIFFGWASNRYGRKYPLMGAALPQLVGWLLIIYAQNPYYLYISRFMSGFSGSANYVILPVFVAEIADTKVRGALGSLFILCVNIGILLAFVLGHVCSYVMMPIILSAVPIIFFVGMCFFPESPQYLMQSGQETEAKKAYCFYRNIEPQQNHEMDLLHDELDKFKPVIVSKDDKENYKSTWSAFNTPVARKAVFLGVALLALKQFTGNTTMLNYAGEIFKVSGSHLGPNMSAIIIGIIQLVGTFTPTLLVDRAGRKVLLVVSSGLTGIGLVCLGVYMCLQSKGYDLTGLGLIPLISFSVVLFAQSCGVVPLPFVVISEILPREAKAIGSTICMVVLWGFAFIMVKTFPIIAATVGMYGCWFLFAGVAFGGVIFVLAVLPETKGKSFDEIMEIMKG